MEAQSYKDLAERVRKIKYIPVPNSIALSLFRTITKKNCTFEDISSIVEPDASLCAQLLRVANSAYYGFKGKVNTINKAVMLIGVDEVRNLSLAICLVNQFKAGVLARGFDLRRFWIHNLLTSFCAREMGKEYPMFDADELYLMGLLHDLGRLAMAQLVPDEFNLIEVKARKKKVLPYVVEKQEGITHTSIGRLLSERWGLTPQISDVLEFHHDPLSSRSFPRECAIVSLSAYQAKMVEFTAGTGPEPELPDTKVFLLAGVELEKMDHFFGKTMELLDEIEVLADIIVGHD